MLGGYYLGQLYLGISGLPSSGSLSVVPSSHQLTSDNTTLTQKHTLIVANTLHGLISDTLGGLINIQPDGFGGGFGAIEAWGVKQFGEINIELPINFLILNLDSNHSVSSDSLNTFIQIFNMIRTGIYIKDFDDDGYVGDEYIKDSGVAIVNKPKLGKLTNQFNALIDETAEFILLSEADEVLIGNIYDGYKFIFMTNRGSEGVFQLDNNKESGTLFIDNITNGELNKIIGEDSEYAYIKSNKHEGII